MLYSRWSSLCYAAGPPLANRSINLSVHVPIPKPCHFLLDWDISTNSSSFFRPLATNWIGLRKLQELDISDNKLTELPALFLHAFKSLSCLNVSRNNLKVFPDAWACPLVSILPELMKGPVSSMSTCTSRSWVPWHTASPQRPPRSVPVLDPSCVTQHPATEGLRQVTPPRASPPGSGVEIHTVLHPEDFPVVGLARWAQDEFCPKQQGLSFRTAVK